MILQSGSEMTLKYQSYKILGVKNHMYHIEAPIVFNNNYKFLMPLWYYGIKTEIQFDIIKPTVNYANTLVHELKEFKDRNTGKTRTIPIMYWYPPEYQEDGIYYKVPLPHYTPDNPEAIMRCKELRSANATPIPVIQSDMDIWHPETREELAKIPIEGTVLRLFTDKYSNVQKVQDIDLRRGNHLKILFKEEVKALLYNKERKSYFKIPVRHLKFK